MYAYAARASTGDDVYHEPCTKALEVHMARVTGKEAALFLPSGTMSNQIALRTHLTQPPYSVLLDHRAHIHKYEAGGTAFHSGAAVTPVVPANGESARSQARAAADACPGHHLTLADVEANAVIGSDVHLCVRRAPQRPRADVW
jgi:threonine aldolase